MTTKFDPNAAASGDSGVFGLPFSEKEAALVFLPVPWEATTSYGAGTSKGPRAILEASRQVDLYDYDVLKPYEPGMYMLRESPKVRAWNKKAKKAAQAIIDVGGDIGTSAKLKSSLKQVNELSEQLNRYVYSETKRIMKAGKIAGIIGGDHSVPLGALRAVAESTPSFGVLHFDAHSDTRDAFEGFKFSHASIMRNVLETIPQVKKLVQVGIRDFCEEEFEYLKSEKSRAQVFFDRDLAKRKFEGHSFWDTCRDIVSALPGEVWVSFDIDGLDPRFCPHTGTPVPGGLDFNEAIQIIWMVAHSGKKIIGFDLNEVSPDLKNKQDEWDANVGARLLYKLSALTLASQGKAQLRI